MKLIAIALVGVGTLCLSGCGPFDRQHFTDTAQETIAPHAVRLDTDSGDVKITGGSPGTTTIKRTVQYSGEKPGATHRMDGDTLTLDGCGQNCRVNYEVRVPGAVRVTGGGDSGNLVLRAVGAVDVHNGSGDVTATDASGAVRVRDDSGDVDIADASGTVQLTAGSGDIRTRGARDAVTATSDSGTVSITASRPVDVEVRNDSGDATVTVPDGRYRVRTNTDSGSVKSAITDDASAKRTLRLRSDSGDLTVASA